MPTHTLTALFDSREYANNAVLMLREAGIPTSDITVSPEGATTGYAALASEHKGFWASLEGMFGDTDDHSTYTEGLRRGSIMVTTHVDEAKMDEAVDILERHGSVDMNEREASWRNEGWTGERITGGGEANEGAGPLRSLAPVEDAGTNVTASRTAEVARATAVRPAADVTAAPVAAMATPVATAPAATARPAVSGTAGNDVLQVVEEQINVGKRAVNRGKVRIHSYVIETPFSETVNLRDETVTVDRRPVDRPVAAADLGADAFRDRTVEMEEVDEEAVVAKTAHVVEEIGLRKDVADRAETVTDTLRSTKVDIEDTRTTGRAAAFFTDATAIERAKDMEVLGSDGSHVGVVDHVQGSTLKLKRDDPASGGAHHLIPTDWVQSVDGNVRLSVTAAEAMRRWTAA